MSIVKLAAAEANFKAGKLSEEKTEAIRYACGEVFSGRYDEQFPLPAVQGGAGTSVNMNVNEVIANIALEKLGKNKGDYSELNPIEDVNLSQSTNDVFSNCNQNSHHKTFKGTFRRSGWSYRSSLQEKETEFADVFKVARTQVSGCSTNHSRRGVWSLCRGSFQG